MINRQLKRIIIRAAFLLEIFVFLGIYVGGSQGLLVLKKLSNANDALEHEIVALEVELETLKNDIVAWNEVPFYKEKFAREQLQMARKDDQIYYLP